MTWILIKLRHFTSTANHRSNSKRGPFDQIPSYHVHYPTPNARLTTTFIVIGKTAIS